MTTGPAQSLVDALADRLRRSVIVEDHTLQLVAFSKDYGDADAARIWSLLNRRSRPDDVYYAKLRAATEPTRVDENAELELYARMAVPIRDHGMLLGFIWLIDRYSTLTEADVANTVDTAAELGKILYRRLVVRDSEDEFVANMIDRLLSDDPAERSSAAVEIVARGYIENDAYIGIVRATFDHPVDDPSTMPTAVQTATRQLSPGSRITRATGRSALVLLARGTPVGTAMDALADKMAAELAGSGFSVRIGVSGVGQGLADALTAAQQAQIALSMAGTRAWRQHVARWSELGPYRLIGQLSPDTVTNSLMPHGVFTLLRSNDAHQLVTTAERFLDCGGDKQEASKLLDIHRSTMYYRLDRIAAITGLDLADGGDRLLLHLAIKLWSLSGPPGANAQH